MAKLAEYVKHFLNGEYDKIDNEGEVDDWIINQKGNKSESGTAATFSDIQSTTVLETITQSQNQQQPKEYIVDEADWMFKTFKDDK
jgi:hypothetical protein